MEILFNKKSLEYNPNHIEGAYRIKDFPSFFEETPCSVKKGLEYLKLLYSEEYISEVKNLFKKETVLAEVQTKPEYFDIACMMVDLAVQASEKEGFAITRPPGHHAGIQSIEGFCFFNNIALAVQHLLNKKEISRICILDIDGHHGNGTQDIFENNHSVLYLSMHQENTYPFSGSLTDSKNVNFPLMEGSSDDILKRVMSLFKKKIKGFKPDYIAISAGFDGYYKDALLNLNFSQKGFHHIGETIEDLNVKTFCCLEGGYHNDILECVETLKDALDGKKYSGKENFTNSNAKVLDDFIEKEKIFKKVHKI